MKTAALRNVVSSVKVILFIPNYTLLKNVNHYLGANKSEVWGYGWFCLL